MKLSIKTLGLAAFALIGINASAALPTIVCSADQILECTSTNGASGVVSVMVQDVDGDGLMVVWAINGEAAATNVLAAGQTTNITTLSLTNTFGPGTNDVSVGVTDDGTNVVMCSLTVVTQDTTPPQIRSIVATPNILWPPNHKMRRVMILVRADDACGPVQWRITDITSNEEVDGQGDGNTSPDWIIGPRGTFLRAERSGNGSGRIYTLNIELSDVAQNTTNGTVTVTVPHDRGRGRGLSRQGPTNNNGNGHANGKDKGNGNGNGHGNGNGNGNGHGNRR
jgi:hypothetical protein